MALFRLVSSVSGDRFQEIDFRRDDGTVDELQIGRSYDLSSAEVLRLSQYVVLAADPTGAYAQPDPTDSEGFLVPLGGTNATDYLAPGLSGNPPIWKILPVTGGGGGGTGVANTGADVGNFGATPSLNMSGKSLHVAEGVLNANATYTISNMDAGDVVLLNVTQDAVGNRTLTISYGGSSASLPVSSSALTTTSYVISTADGTDITVMCSGIGSGSGGSGSGTAATTSFVPVGGVAATDVQAAIAEIDAEKASVTALNTKADTSALTTNSAFDRDRTNHTNSQLSSTISDFLEATQDAVAGMLLAGSNVTLSYDDTLGKLTIAVPTIAVASAVSYAGSPDLAAGSVEAALDDVASRLAAIEDLMDSVVMGDQPGLRLSVLTEAAYTALGVKSQNTLYGTYNVSSFVVQDLFARTVTDALGSAASGQAWTTVQNAADYDVLNGYAYINNLTAGSDRQAYLSTVSQRDVDIRMRFSFDQLPATGGGVAYLYGRQQSISQFYRLGITVGPTAFSNFVAQGTNSSGTVIYAPTGVAMSGTPAINNDYWIRLKMTGASPTTIEGWFWDAASSMPASPQWTSSDSTAGLQVAGNPGFNMRLGSNSSPLNFKWRIKEYTVQ